MTTAFDRSRRLIVVRVEIDGPNTPIVFDAALDTGSTKTVVSESLFIDAGYEPGLSQQRVTVNTTSGQSSANIVPIDAVRALGHERRAFPVLAHNLPTRTGVRGLLGLDFLEACAVTIVLSRGLLTLSQP